MEFFGVDGWPAPRLKDAEISQKRAKRLYHDCIVIMRRMFQECRLVHGDLSEYNMLCVFLLSEGSLEGCFWSSAFPFRPLTVFLHPQLLQGQHHCY
jgi:hypothetical protein